MRYVGQSFTLSIPWNPADHDWSTVREALDARHRETFGYADLDNDVEIVNVRLVSLGLVDKPRLTFTPRQNAGLTIECRRVWFDGWIDCPVLDREAMQIGSVLEGPAIIEEAGGTSVVPPGWSVGVHPSGALLCTFRDS
jgi:N-methylhydantoinase A